MADAMTYLTHWDVIATRVTNDEGITGWGYNCTLAEGSAALKTLIEDDLAPKLIGKDPLQVDRLWQTIYFGAALHWDHWHCGSGGRRARDRALGYQRESRWETPLGDAGRPRCHAGSGL